MSTPASESEQVKPASTLVQLRDKLLPSYLRSSTMTADWLRPTTPVVCLSDCCMRKTLRSSGRQTNDPSPGKQNLLFKSLDFFIVRLGSHEGSGLNPQIRDIHTFSEAPICDVSEQLKQDGGSSRGSGDRVWIVVPTGTSSEREQISIIWNYYTVKPESVFQQLLSNEDRVLTMMVPKLEVHKLKKNLNPWHQQHLSNQITQLHVITALL